MPAAHAVPLPVPSARCARAGVPAPCWCGAGGGGPARQRGTGAAQRLHLISPTQRQFVCVAQQAATTARAQLEIRYPSPALTMPPAWIHTTCERCAGCLGTEHPLAASCRPQVVLSWIKSSISFQTQDIPEQRGCPNSQPSPLPCHIKSWQAPKKPTDQPKTHSKIWKPMSRPQKPHAATSACFQEDGLGFAWIFLTCRLCCG